MVIGYDLNIWQSYHIADPVTYNLESCPHTLITGASGSGKSYGVKLQLRELVKNNVKVWICDFKKSDDFLFLKNYENYFSYTSCERGIEEYYEQFKRAVEFSTVVNQFNILIFDEYPAFILYESTKDKKKAEQYKLMISEMLMLGRSYKFGIWLVMQRPDSQLLSNGARDNFMVTISYGKLSKESRSMLYSGEDYNYNRLYRKGEGVCYIDNQGLREVKTGTVRSMSILEQEILNQCQCR